jgi:hypothetical protein
MPSDKSLGMTDSNSDAEVLAVKDESHQLPIPSAWRPVFRKIVGAIVQRDYRLSAGVPGVAPVADNTAAQIEKYIAGYGETLVDLPEETWDSSVCIWQVKRWDALVDLWTRREGRSDLVLSAHVFESDAGFEFHIDMVYVP